MAKSDNNNNSGSRFLVPILAVTFAGTGAALNLLQQQLYYAGAGDGSLLILILPTFLGMAVGGLSSKNTRQEVFYPGNNNNDSTKPKFTTKELIPRMKQFIMVSVTDVTSLTLRSLSQNLCGSGMFTVIYASLPAFNGVLSYIFLGRILNKFQWMSMLVVVTGLAFSADAAEGAVEGKKLHQVFLGILLGLAGTFFSSASYICAEKVLKSPNAPKHPTTLTAINGINDLMLTAPWVLFYSIPHRQDLLYEPVAAKGQSPYYLAFLWACLVLSNALHLNACYMLLRITESVTLTMLQGVRAVMVFAISGALFCNSKTPEQCLNTQKVVCSFVVLFGVVMYAKSTAGLSKHMGMTDNDLRRKNAKRGHHLKAKQSDDEDGNFVENDDNMTLTSDDNDKHDNNTNNNGDYTPTRTTTSAAPGSGTVGTKGRKRNVKRTPNSSGDGTRSGEVV